MRTKFILILSSIALVLCVLILAIYFWFVNKQERVLNGAARAEFPYRDYSISELNKLYPQYMSQGVVTIQTPEETYELLKIFLKKGDTENALNLFSGKYYSKYQEIFVQAKKNNKLDELYNKLDSKIEKSNTDCFETRCTYIMENSQTEIDFVKDEKGVWRIVAL